MWPAVGWAPGGTGVIETVREVVPGGIVSPPGWPKSCACGGASFVARAMSGLELPDTARTTEVPVAPPCSPGGGDSQR